MTPKRNLKSGCAGRMYITLTQRSERLRIIKQKPSVLTLLHLQILLVSFVLAITYLAVTTDAHAEARIEESAPRIAFLIPPAERFDGFAVQPLMIQRQKRRVYSKYLHLQRAALA
jgi:hypothetical protein